MQWRDLEDSVSLLNKRLVYKPWTIEIVSPLGLRAGMLTVQYNKLTSSQYIMASMLVTIIKYSGSLNPRLLCYSAAHCMCSCHQILSICALGIGAGETGVRMLVQWLLLFLWVIMSFISDVRSIYLLPECMKLYLNNLSSKLERNHRPFTVPDNIGYNFLWAF